MIALEAPTKWIVIIKPGKQLALKKWQQINHKINIL
jgi:hypothetical protein